MNKVILIGRLGADVEMHYANNQNQTPIANLRLATSERRGSEEHTEWHRCVAFGKLAEIMAQYLAKGSRVMLEGRLQTRKWQDNDGNDRYATEIVVNEMEMLGDGNGSGGQRQVQAGGQGRQAQGQGQAQPPAQDFGDGDIPF